MTSVDSTGSFSATDDSAYMEYTPAQGSSVENAGTGGSAEDNSGMGYGPAEDNPDSHDAMFGFASTAISSENHRPSSGPDFTPPLKRNVEGLLPPPDAVDSTTYSTTGAKRQPPPQTVVISKADMPRQNSTSRSPSLPPSSNTPRADSVTYTLGGIPLFSLPRSPSLTPTGSTVSDLHPYPAERSGSVSLAASMTPSTDRRPMLTPVLSPTTKQNIKELVHIPSNDEDMPLRYF